MLSAHERLAPNQRRFVILFVVMLMLYAGNTALQSIMPAVGRSLGLPDWLIALAFSFSALVWAVAAPAWANRSDRISGRTMIIVGLTGFVASLSLSGLVLSLGLLGMIPAIATFLLFIACRLIYAVLGSAAPAVTQAMVAQGTHGPERTRAIAALASAVGLGTILGPALAPFFSLPVIGLGGPGFVFAGIGVGVLVVVIAQLPKDTLPAGYTTAADEPAIGGEPDIGLIAEARLGSGARKLRWLDTRIRSWLIAGFVIAQVQTAVGQLMGFMVIDRLGIAPALAQPMIGLVLMSGAGAALLAQWGIIPRFDLSPRTLVLGGAVIGAFGTLGVGFARDMHGICMAFGLASLGFGLARPGFTAGASLAVDAEEQASVAGIVTAINGYSFVLSPTVGILLYRTATFLPHLAGFAALLLMVLCMRGPLPKEMAGSAT